MNFSAVWGNGLPPAILAQRPEAAGHKFFATETSMVLHPRNPYVPTLNLGTKVSPTRRVWIPKPGTEEKRPLGIPTMKDRALQALVKLALEPEWEARFEPNSYGFRAGRSCHDAAEAIFNAIQSSTTPEKAKREMYSLRFVLP